MADGAIPTHMQFQLVTPEKIFFSGEAAMVTIPGTLGEFGVLPGHAPFVSTLRPGIITIELPDHQKKKLVVLSGLAEVVPDHCVVLAESAEDCSTITQADAQARLAEAKKALDDAITDAQKKDAAFRLEVAETLAASF